MTSPISQDAVNGNKNAAYPTDVEQQGHPVPNTAATPKSLGAGVSRIC